MQPPWEVHFGVIDDAGLEIVASFGGTGDLQQFGGNAPDMSKGYEALKQSHPNIDYLGACKLVPIAGTVHLTEAKDKAPSLSSHKGRSGVLSHKQTRGQKHAPADGEGAKVAIGHQAADNADAALRSKAREKASRGLEVGEGSQALVIFWVLWVIAFLCWRRWFPEIANDCDMNPKALFDSSTTKDS